MLVDTSVLARILQPHHPSFAVTEHALDRLLRQKRQLHVVPQNLIELWVVATQPAAQNGLGMTPTSASVELTKLKRMFVLLADTHDIYAVWESLVIQYEVSGKPAHDAKLVAAMKVHRLDSILTFDTGGFRRYPGIDVIHPADVAATRL